MKRSTPFATSSKATLAVLFVVVGCWSSSPTSSPAETSKKPAIEGPGEQAERTLRADAPFDLAFPEQTPPRRDAATKVLVTACRAGHHPSCWLLLHVASSESALEVGLADVVSQCEKRELSSCQAIPPLPAHPLLPAGLPGETGRLLSQKLRAPTEAESAELRRECRDGFAYSCKVLAERSPELAERRGMHVKMSLAARAGCRRKNPDACALVEPDWPAEDRFAAVDWNCQVRRSACNRLGAALLAVGRVTAARDEYERACQYGGEPVLCLELAQLYRDGKLTEPIKGREVTLLHVACASLEADGDAHDYPECASSP
jgi:hypothetical protein